MNKIDTILYILIDCIVHDKYYKSVSSRISNQSIMLIDL